MSRSNSPRDLAGNADARIDGKLQVEQELILEAADSEDDVILTNNAGELNVNGSPVGGGSSAVVGARKSLSETILIANADEVDFDTVDYDTDSFNLSVNRLRVPAGLGGLYAITASADIGAFGADKNLLASIIIFREEDPIGSPGIFSDMWPCSQSVHFNGTNAMDVSLYCEVALEDLDQICLNLDSLGTNNFNVTGEFGAQAINRPTSLTIRRLGDDPAA